MFVLAHLSDLHLASRPQLRELAGKRVLGFINWHRGRKKIHRVEVLDAITRDLKAGAVDHIAVTGDLVNLSLPAEYKRARAWLETLGPASDVTVIPGNHDIYVPEVRRHPAESWGDYMRGDDGADAGSFPFLRRRGPVALIALSSAVPTAPLLATGRLGESALASLAKLLDQTSGLFRIVLIHHPPVSPIHRYLRRLIDAAEFRRVLADKGAELVLHGHDHCRSLVWLDGPRTRIPAVGVPSASARAPHRAENAAGYNLYRIDGAAGAWRCELIARERGPDGKFCEAERRVLS
ncbi:MAG TPA: metallophosphoesterase [Xanthobacteraceae bacterium]|nr:metallophosphoesterase [Xanthobacteraceae bacterium]